MSEKKKDWSEIPGFHVGYGLEDMFPRLSDPARLHNQSGDPTTWDTGAKRDTNVGKGRFDLIPPEPQFRLALRLEAGAEHYGDRNWEKGIPLSRYVEAHLRHFNQWLLGMVDEDHLGAALFNINALVATEERALKGQLPRDLIDIGPNKE